MHRSFFSGSLLISGSLVSAALLTLGSAILSVPAEAAATAFSPKIRLSQIGFHPQAGKKGVVVNTAATTFFIATPDLADTVFSGILSAAKAYTPADEQARLADFTACVRPGQYVLGVPGEGVSHPFRIDSRADLEMAKGAIRAFYYQRASAALLAATAGKWARNAGHPDNRVYVHSSAASAARPAETILPASKGWYDAGDYNKYIVNSGITTYTLLSLYRSYPAFFDTLKLNLPESGNAIPDLLDEALWNLRWMLAMQDPNDGGVYHKLTSPDFSGFVMPEADGSKRYLVQKTTTAALNLAATAAYSSRLFRKFNGPLPGFADSALNVARKAWQWARANPKVYYIQADLNKTFTPAINTGEYGDRNATDEFFWAGMELYLATKEDSFYVAAAPTGALPAAYGIPGWNSVQTLGLYSLADEMNNGFDRIDAQAVKSALSKTATVYRDRALASPYGVATNDFFWGGTSADANQGILLMQAFRATGDSTFLKAAVDALDYLTGRNATGYSFITGFGSKTPLFPHHRPSGADGIAEPIPGFLVGGPNSGQDDKSQCVYPSTLPALSYTDMECSYASNEVAINWNAPFAYLAGALEATYGAGINGVGILRRPSAGSSEAIIGWEGKRLRVLLPQGWHGKLEVFDMRGVKVNQAAMDTAGSLWAYRLMAEDAKGFKVFRTGALSPFSSLRVDLGR